MRGQYQPTVLVNGIQQVKVMGADPEEQNEEVGERHATIMVLEGGITDFCSKIQRTT